MTKQLAELPEDAVKQLKDNRQSPQKAQFYAMVYHLREAGWPLRAIASPLGVSRSAARNWEVQGRKLVEEDNITTSILPEKWRVPATTHGTGTRAVRIPRDLNAADKVRIKELADVARNRTRWSNDNSPEAKASRELEDMIRTYVRRKVPVSTIAKHMGVTRRAVAQRIERIGV